MRSHAIEFLNFIKEIPSILKEELGSIHSTISQEQLLDSMGSLSCFSSQEQGESQGIKSMQVYHEAHGVHEISQVCWVQFLVISIKINYTQRLREYEECVCTNHHLKRKKRWLRKIRVGLIEPEVWSSLSGSHLSCSSPCRTGDVVQHVGGEILNEFANGVFERSTPHLFLYLLLFKRKTIQTRILTVSNYPGVKFLLRLGAWNA